MKQTLNTAEMADVNNTVLIAASFSLSGIISVFYFNA